MNAANLMSPTDSARSSGVFPSVFLRPGSAPASRRTDTTSVDPDRAAACRGDSPFWKIMHPV